MMAEPTLGARILTSAMCLHITVGSDDLHEEWATLRALCDRATAAENLAVATVRRDNAKDVWVGGEDAAAIMEAFPVYEMELAKYKTALRAWRAIMAGNQQGCDALTWKPMDNALAAWRALGEVDDA